MAEYTLMNKNHPVVSFRYDRDIHAVVKIVDVHDLRYAPVALADSSDYRKYREGSHRNIPKAIVNVVGCINTLF